MSNQEDDDVQIERRRSYDTRAGIERHLQTLLQAILLALAYWVGNGIDQLQTQFARTDERITALQQSFKDLQQRAALRGEVEPRFRAIEDRVDEIEASNGRRRRGAQ